MDSSQVLTKSADGSTANFNFMGGDADLAHFESHTATVSLAQFHAVHTIYNVNDNSNKIEIYNQYLSSLGGSLLNGNSTVIQIPNGNYNLTTLMQILNQKMFDIFGVSNANGYYQGFGDNTQNFCIPAFYADFVTTENYIPTISATTGSAFYPGNENNVVENAITGKIKFCTPSLAKMTPYSQYRGFYIITDTYQGLPNLLGFTASKAYNLPTYKTLLSNSKQKGYGITVSYNLSTTTYILDPTYSASSHFTDTTSFVTGVSGSIVSATVFTCLAPDFPSLDYPRNIYISIDQITTRNGCSNPKYSFGSILAKVPTNQTFGNTILYEPFGLKEIMVPGLSLDAFTVRLFDDYGDAIQWNSGNWTMILNVTYNIDVGAAGLEDASMGRTYRPYLQGTQHDPLTTSKEFALKRNRYE